MARLFGDNTSPTFNSTTYKYKDTPLSSYLLFNYGTIDSFQGKVDNSMASVMRDCAECHVGGGGMEYIPNKSPDARIALRNYTTTNVNTYSYYIDQYGPAGDSVGATFLATKNDFRTTGVMEMDCLICHLKDYNYEGRKHAVRKGQFDASRTAGAGIGTPIDGLTVNYDPTKVVNDGFGNRKLAAGVVANILSTPDTNNCVNCHMQEHAVDWKKRGDQWTTDEVHYSIGCLGCHKRPDADFSKVGTSGFSGLKGTYGFGNISSAANSGYDANRLGQCDPSKGHAPYGSLWNKNDGPYGNQAKGFDYACKGCHIEGGYWDGNTFKAINTLNAPNPTATHDAAFLTAKIVQDGTYAGTTPTKSHLDVITCTGCHTSKGNYSGGAMVDGTGADAEGRLADHENTNVERNMLGNIVYEWQDGILIPSNLSTSIFWRDKNDYNFDANGDGREGGMDALLQTHVADINRENGLTALTQYTGGIDASIIGNHISTISANIETKRKVGAANDVIKLSFMGVGFKSNHGVGHTTQARGSATRGGCTDCHGANKGYYNGPFRVIGANIPKFEFAGNQITPFAMVNGSTQPTDFHVGMKDRSNVRSIAVQFASYSATSPNIHTVRNIDRGDTMYESSFKKRNGTWKQALVGSGMTAAKYPDCNGGTSTTKGWLLKVEVQDPGVTDTTVTPIATLTRQVMGCYSTAKGMVNDADGNGLSVLNNATNNPYFTISTPVDDYNITITAKDKTLGNPYVIRLHPQTDAGNPASTAASFGLGNELWEAKTYTGVVKIDGTSGLPSTAGVTQTAAGRASWSAYLDKLGTDVAATKAYFGLGNTPVAAMTSTDDLDSVPGLQFVTGTRTINATTTGNSPYVTYKWQFSDGATGTTSSISRAFTAGNYTVTLTATGVDGKSASTTQSISVSDSYNTGMTISSVPATPLKGQSTSFTFGSLPAHYTVKISWGDYKGDTISDPASSPSITKSHTYLSSGTKKVGLTLLNSAGAQVAQKYFYITVQ